MVQSLRLRSHAHYVTPPQASEKNIAVVKLFADGMAIMKGAEWPAAWIITIYRSTYY